MATPRDDLAKLENYRIERDGYTITVTHTTCKRGKAKVFARLNAISAHQLLHTISDHHRVWHSKG